MKLLLAIFGRFLITFDIFDPGILIFVSQRSSWLRREILESRFWTFHHNFNSKFSERPAGISNVRPEFQTFGWNLERLAGIQKRACVPHCPDPSADRTCECPGPRNLVIYIYIYRLLLGGSPVSGASRIDGLLLFLINCVFA